MIAILGAGESGVGAALLAKAKGLEVFVSDMSEIKPVYKGTLTQNQIPFEEGKHSFDTILSADEIIKSPGIPEKADIIKKARAKGIPVISEIEFAGRYTKAKFICITGTNGKTTTTLLTYHILKAAGFNVALAGNIGESLAAKVIEDTYDYYVLELSSFQLDGMYDFRAHIGILTNITPDHLDRYEYSMEKYAQSKLRILQNQDYTNYFIYNYEDELTIKYFDADAYKGEAVPFALEKDHVIKGFFDGPILKTIVLDQEHLIDTSKSTLIGKHNQYNTLAAVLAAKILEVDDNTIAEALATFKNADHRLQKLGEANGVTYINDSKATNVEAVYFALEGIKQPIVWIAGGTDKGNDYTTLLPLAKEKVKALICLGVDNEKLKTAFSDVVPVVVETQSVTEAVKMAEAAALPGDVVLLSPACASFDLFKNYEDRGRQFAQAVNEVALAKKETI